MVLAGKIFLVKEASEIGSIAAKLKGFKSEEVVELGEKKVPLITEIRDLKMVGDDLHGVFSQDFLIEVSHHGVVVSTPITSEAPFLFSRYKDSLLLVILEKKLRANNIANQLSKILFITTGMVVEARIPPEIFRRFHEENFEDTKVIFFDDVDIPNVNKLSLYGSGLANTSLYVDYCGHGKVWYIVLKPKKYGIIVGVTRNCVVTMFSKAEREELVDYMKREVFPLIGE